MLTKDNGENWDCYQFHRMHPQQKRKSHVKLKKSLYFYPQTPGDQKSCLSPIETVKRCQVAAVQQ